MITAQKLPSTLTPEEVIELTGATPSDRAGILATVHLISYSCTAIPGLIAGALTRALSAASSRSRLRTRAREAAGVLG